MLILIIGPSAVGKSTTTRRYAEKYRNCTFVDLDDAIAHLNETETAYPTVVKFGWEKFYQDCQSIVAEFEVNEDPNALTLVDVGEGVLWKEVSRDWLSKFKKISLIASAEEIHKRAGSNRQSKMTFEDYCRYNFSEGRKQLYQNCDAVIDCNSLSIEQVVDKMAITLQTTFHLKLSTY